MLRSIINRLLMLVLMFVLFSLFVFTLMRLAPGDPASMMLLEIGGGPEQSLVANLQEQWGLDQSFIQQYLVWVFQIFQGELGNSFMSGEPVVNEIMNRLEPTFRLISGSFLITVVFSIPIGIWLGLNEGSIPDRVVYSVTILGLSVPLYWLAILLMYTFGVLWPILPVVGSSSGLHYVLPITAISLVQSVYFIRMIRSYTIQYSKFFYIEAARARGLRPYIFYPSYLLRSMYIPVLTLVATSLPGFFGASIITETIYSFPGFSKYMLEAIYRRDFPVIQGSVLLVAAFIFVFNFVADILYYLADPRIHLDKQRWEI
ncbi:peptide/nickel transport system permease protein [Fontibacillus phaseoli]|uniref:Peptide/nickel transport system permease protein n=1 Tax=Fontibacillus phaseoli TaxID=1416533 RepID=A0A369B1J2_9BACL|nr:ABC transporter permease [Fontibacillus phaseoli]RCX15419.1 peptide/nickel transport system permease protein [Fontibacillus phaseoli]